MKTDIAILYASHDGQTRKVALHIAGKLMDEGLILTLDDLEKTTPALEDLQEADQIVLIAPVRFGHHLPSMDRFVVKNRALLAAKRLVMVSLNLTARKEDKDTPETNPYMGKWIKKLGVQPEGRAVFAGKLNYAQYPWWEKHVVRLIMKITGGPTNLDANIEFTRWDRVDALAAQIVAAQKKKVQAA